jgi:hypothetical protein
MLNIAAQIIWMNDPRSAEHQTLSTKIGRAVRPVAARAAEAIAHCANNALAAEVGLDGRIFRDAWRTRFAVMSTKRSCVSAQPNAIKRNDHAGKGTSTPGGVAFESQMEVQHELSRRTRTTRVNNNMAISWRPAATRPARNNARIVFPWFTKCRPTS